MVFLSIVVFIIVLSIIIIIHEFGHFIMARKAGILCYEFSIGFGPKIWSKKKGETTYSIRAIPLGGYVQMAGEEGTGVILEDDIEIGYDISDDLITHVYLDGNGENKGILKAHEIYKEMYLEIENNEGNVIRYNLKKDCMFSDDSGNEIQAAPYERCFESKTIWQRFLALFAGPFMNFVLGIIVLIIYSFIVGTPDFESTVVGNAYYNSAEAVVKKIGYQDITDGRTVSLEGFKINEINGNAVSKWNDLSKFNDTISAENDYEIIFTATKDNETYELSVKPYVFLGSLGVYTDLNDKSDLGVKVYLYCVNAENAKIIGDKSENTYSIITKINDTEIKNVSDLIEFSKNNVGSQIEMTLLDNEGKEYKANYKMYDQKTVEKLKIGLYDISYGISPTNNVKFFKCLGNSFKYFKNDAMSVFNTLNLLFTSKDVGVKNLSGPVGIYQLVSNSLSQGFTSLVSLIGLLTINIGIVNLLPIPALDGGRIVFLLYELITRKTPNKKFENALNSIMFILIMILFIYITFNDILRF